MVNELMSSNQSYIVDVSDDKYEDWAELYNTTNQDIDLGGLYFSDDFAKKINGIFQKAPSSQPKGDWYYGLMKTVQNLPACMLISNYLQVAKN